MSPGPRRFNDGDLVIVPGLSLSFVVRGYVKDGVSLLIEGESEHSPHHVILANPGILQLNGPPHLSMFPTTPPERVNLFMVIDDQDEPYFGLVTKEYWEREHCLSDYGFDNHDSLPPGFSEVSESEYVYDKGQYTSFEEAKRALLAAGFVEIPNTF